MTPSRRVEARSFTKGVPGPIHSPQTNHRETIGRTTGPMMSVLQQSFWDRLTGVVTLQRAVYEAIQRDPQATGQA